MPGTYIFSCSECDTDLCSSCEASEPRRAAPAKQHAKARAKADAKAKPTKPAGTPAAAFVTIPEQEAVPFHLEAAASASTQPNISSVAEGGSPAPQQRSA